MSADADNVTVEVWDATGNKKTLASLPKRSPVNRILVLLVDKMSLPRHSPDGQLMSYKFHHKASGRQLLDEATLQDSGVKEGDVLRIQPEITAGAYVAPPPSAEISADMSQPRAVAPHGWNRLPC